jgi:hypothetical protein
MDKPRFVVCLVYPALLLAYAPGCQLLYRYKPVPILVRDAETKAPIAGAEVHISYPLSRPSTAPYESVETTAQDGRAHLRAAPYGGEAGIVVTAAAKDYMSEERTVLAETIRDLPSPPLLKASDPPAAPFVVEMYAEPHPTIELVVPVGYRGVVECAVEIQEDAPFPRGQRCFSCDVSSSGVARLKGPPLLRRVSALDYRAKFADGTPLSHQAEASAVGLRWLKCEGSTQFFAVCTQGEYAGIRYSLHIREPAESRSAANGPGEQRVRRHRRGGQTSSP